MRNSMKKTLFAACIFILTSAALFSGDKGWTIDKSHSNIGFSVKHMVISKVTGNFKKYDVTFNATKDDFSDGYVEAVIDATSINTDNEKRDFTNHLRCPFGGRNSLRFLLGR